MSDIFVSSKVSLPPLGWQRVALALVLRQQFFGGFQDGPACITVDEPDLLSAISPTMAASSLEECMAGMLSAGALIECGQVAQDGFGYVVPRLYFVPFKQHALWQMVETFLAARDSVKVLEDCERVSESFGFQPVPLNVDKFITVNPNETVDADVSAACLDTELEMQEPLTRTMIRAAVVDECRQGDGTYEFYRTMLAEADGLADAAAAEGIENVHDYLKQAVVAEALQTMMDGIVPKKDLPQYFKLCKTIGYESVLWAIQECETKTGLLEGKESRYIMKVAQVHAQKLKGAM